MLTFEKVIEVFSDYLKEDEDYEVVLTSKGYTLLGFDPRAEDWATIEYCKTPEKLLEALSDSYESLRESEKTKGRRELEKSEQEEILAEIQVCREKCYV